MSIFKTPKGSELPILDMRGKPYLQVAYRLVWFREERPLWTIETEPVALTDNSSYFKATIRDESGRIMATGHKFEDKQGFADHREKAETGAIGRALALVGYGTQFCADELDEGQRLADSPMQPARQAAPARQAPVVAPSSGLAPEHCGGKMLISKYNPNEFYCPKCKAKAPVAA